jgi:Tol biopolymer transport system component
LPVIRNPPYSLATRGLTLTVLGAAALLLGAGAAPARETATRFVGNDAPNWSPDGKRIAFTTFRHGRSDIYVVNSDGSGERRLTNDPAADDLATWSPDGSKIAFVSNRDGNFDVYAMNADGTGERRLTTDPEDDFSPSWSPDGRRIVFRSNRDENGEIYVMSADGTQQTRLTNNPASDHSPSWGPNGQIAFVSQRQGIGIYVMNDDGTNVRRVSTFAPNRNEYKPNWSPDGKRIVFQADRDTPVGNTEIYVMNADGTSQQRLTNYPGHDDWPDWSPDGSQIVFSRGASFLTPEVYVMGATGGEPREVTLPALEIFKFTLAPKRPAAGKRVTATLIVFEASGADLGTPTVACSANLAGRSLAARHAVLLGHGAVCMWDLPRTAKGKRFIGTVSARSGISRVQRKFTVRVR